MIQSKQTSLMNATGKSGKRPPTKLLVNILIAVENAFSSARDTYHQYTIQITVQSETFNHLNCSVQHLSPNTIFMFDQLAHTHTRRECLQCLETSVMISHYGENVFSRDEPLFSTVIGLILRIFAMKFI